MERRKSLQALHGSSRRVFVEMFSAANQVGCALVVGVSAALC